MEGQAQPPLTEAPLGHSLMPEYGSLPALLTEAEAAEYLGVTELTLYRWRKAGKISCYTASKSPRYSEQHILDYLKAHEVPVMPASGPKPTSAQRQRKRQEDGPPMALAFQILREAKARNEGG